MCNCDKEKLEEFKKTIVGNKGPWKPIDIDGEYIKGRDGRRLYDSFGFRGQVPGECDECYEEYRQSYDCPI